jgi:hypothetical protein
MRGRFARLPVASRQDAGNRNVSWRINLNEADQLRVEIVGYVDSDERERASLASELESVLWRSDVDDVSRLRTEAPSGAKGNAVEWAQLVVTGIGSLPALISSIHGWRAQRPGASISIEIDGDVLTLSDSTPSERDDLIQTWLERHAR